jgi:uncharacterized protein (TIGR03118 family)
MHARRLLTAALGLATGLSIAIPGVAANARDTAEGAFHQTNLVSNVPGMAALTDPSLRNPWGISARAQTATQTGSPMWVSDNNAGVTTLYNGAGQKVPLTVTIPPGKASPADGPGSPTGTVFNGSSAFNGDLFLFATEDGTIAGWKGSDGPTAQTEVDRGLIGEGAVYKGLAIGNNGTGDHLYAANFRFGTIEVFDAGFNLVSLRGTFTDRKIPVGFAPFNIQNLGGRLYVTYAKQKPDKHDDLSGPGNGFVDVYDLNGHLLRRLIRHGALNSPWGLAIAPEDFGPFGGDLLVGNFGDGHINAYSPRSGRWQGVLSNEAGTPITISGLWGLRFGTGGASGDPHTLFFAAGINEEQDGLFGSIRSTEQD